MKKINQISLAILGIVAFFIFLFAEYVDFSTSATVTLCTVIGLLCLAPLPGLVMDFINCCREKRRNKMTVVVFFLKACLLLSGFFLIGVYGLEGLYSKDFLWLKTIGLSAFTASCLIALPFLAMKADEQQKQLEKQLSETDPE